MSYFLHSWGKVVVRALKNSSNGTVMISLVSHLYAYMFGVLEISIPWEQVKSCRNTAPKPLIRSLIISIIFSEKGKGCFGDLAGGTICFQSFRLFYCIMKYKNKIFFEFHNRFLSRNKAAFFLNTNNWVQSACYV